MIISPSEIYSYYRPSKCFLRVFLRHKGELEADPSPFQVTLRKLGTAHEIRHLQTFPAYTDLSQGAHAKRISKTIEEVRKGTPVLYHPLFKAILKISGEEIEVLGEPDFLIKEGSNYLIRDTKISRRITEKDHPEIFRQLEIYGWLFEQTFKKSCSGLQVLSGTNELHLIPYTGLNETVTIIQEIVETQSSSEEPYSPVGWTKCNGCGFNNRCWPQAEERRDVAIVYDVDQGLATSLRQDNITTIKELLSNFDETSLAEFKKHHGEKMRRVGKKASSILRMAHSLESGQEILIKSPEIPESKNYVMFDLEGLPPHMDELDKIYLWGLQVFGENSGEFNCGLAGFGEDGDREGWNQFLEISKNIFDEYGDIPFVHWHHYERTKLDMYVKRYGDTNGAAQRVRENLLDLLPITKNSIALPLPSYSLKVIEKYIGFERTQDEYGGDWAMAMYIEATETEDEEKRDGVMEKIILYNKEDLEATWAVLQWLKSKGDKN